MRSEKRVATLVVWVLLSGAMVFSQGSRQDPALERLLRWFDAVQRHTPGSADIPATELGMWLRIDLDAMVGDVRRVAAFQRSVRENRVGAYATLELYDRRFSAGDIEKIFDGNATLRRAAVLHADVGLLVTHDATRQRGPGNDSGSLMVDDGQRRGIRYESGHWQIGRAVLDLIAPAAAADAGALLWYRAISAHLLHNAHLGELRDHLARARQIFPNDWPLLLDSAELEEKLSSASIQAAVDALRAGGEKPSVEPRRSQLGRAERLFRQVLALKPDQTEARLRLGHALGELERHEEAVIELRKAIDGAISGEPLYQAELFLGREEEALGRKEEARRHYENAAELYPLAQSPRLALAQLARQSGDRAAALRAFKVVTALSPVDAARWDPWWAYYEYHGEDWERLLEQMRGLARMAAR